MLKIRLQRTGRKHEPTFRVILTESHRGPKTGRFIENLGFYDAKNGTKSLKAERITYWLGKGAKASDTVHNFLVSKKIITGSKIPAFILKPRVKEEVPAKDATPIVSNEETVEKTEVSSSDESPKEEVVA